MDRIESKAERPDKLVGNGRTASRFDLILDTVGRLLRRGAIGNLERMVSKMHPADVAKMLHHLNTAQEKRTVFELIKPDSAKAKVLSEMDEADIGDVLQDAPSADIAMLIKDLPDDDQAYVLTTLPEERSQEVHKLMTRYNLLAIPVVDKETRLVGIITVDDVVDIIHDAATEDMMKMSGTQIEEEEEIMHSSVFQAVRLRVPWLLTNLIGSMVSGSILWFFRYTIEEVVALVTLIPVIASMGGHVGLQSSTMIIRGLATGRIELSDVKRVFAREVLIGFLIGLLCGGVTLAVAATMHINLHLGLVVGVAMVCALVMSTSMATIMPVVLKRYGVDPAVAAGPFVTTANDITGITIYLSLATAYLSYLQ